VRPLGENSYEVSKDNFIKVLQQVGQYQKSFFGVSEPPITYFWDQNTYRKEKDLSFGKHAFGAILHDYDLKNGNECPKYFLKGEIC
jgi:hypothetical protein